jgi:hypothetical protein
VGRDIDEIEFRRVLARPYANGRQRRDAVEIEVNGTSLSRTLDAAPFDVEQIRSLGPLAWSRAGNRVPVLNCGCGEMGCGGFLVDIQADDETVTWTISSPTRTMTFDIHAFRSSLDTAMSG